VESGFKQTSGVSADVTIGVSATVTIDMTIHCVSVSHLEKLYTDNKHNFSAEAIDTLDKYSAGGQGGFIFPFLSLCASGSVEHTSDKKTYNFSDTKDSKVVKEILDNVQETDCTLSGTLTLTGISYIPSVGRIYYEAIQVQLGKKQSLTVVADTPTTATDGPTKPTQSDLHILADTLHSASTLNVHESKVLEVEISGEDHEVSIISPFRVLTLRNPKEHFERLEGSHSITIPIYKWVSLTITWAAVAGGLEISLSCMGISVSHVFSGSKNWTFSKGPVSFTISIDLTTNKLAGTVEVTVFGKKVSKTFSVSLG